VIATVPVGTGPVRVGADPKTNRIYVANYGSNTVSVIADS
jgi:DNA-binding beta-propeller fold protein YncE